MKSSSARAAGRASEQRASKRPVSGPTGGQTRQSRGADRWPVRYTRLADMQNFSGAAGRLVGCSRAETREKMSPNGAAGPQPPSSTWSTSGRPVRWTTRGRRKCLSLICATIGVLALAGPQLRAGANESDSRPELISGSPHPTTPTTASALVTSTTFTSSSTAAAAAAPPGPTPGGPPGVSRRDLSAKSLQSATITASPAGRGGDGVCRVNDGESVAVMEIEESRDSDTSQWTQPRELPIGGSPDEIELKIESETHKFFHIQDKSLRLTRPLDRDAKLKEISCVDKRQPPARQAKKTIIPVLVKVLDLNDNAPRFSQPVYSVQVNELAPVGTVVLDQLAYAVDLDSANNGQIEYSLLGAPSPAADAVAADRVGPRSGASSRPGSTTSQRLVQRAEPTPGQNSHQATSRPADAVTSATRAPNALSTHSSSSAPPSTTTSTPAARQARNETKSAGEEPVTLVTTAVSIDGTSEEDSDDEAAHSTPPPTSANSSETTQHESQKTPAEPTINLNSEPILNGPMEDSEEEESDEALLASINAASGNSSEPDGEQPPVGDQSDFASSSARAFLSRWGKPRPAKLAPTHRRLKRTRRQSAGRSGAPSQAGPDAAAATARRKQQQPPVVHPETEVAPDQPPPWTNLMVIPSDEIQSLDAVNNPYSASSLALKQDLSSEEEAAALAASALTSNDFFELELSPQTQRPVIRLKRQLDFETRRLHQLTLVATDRAPNKNDRLSSQAKILIRVLDGDDQPPAFILDQSGCATNLVPQATSPVPPMELASESTPRQPDEGLLTNQARADPLHQEASESPPKSAVKRLLPRSAPQSADANLRLKSFKVTDENFDFGDTLGLDDLPLDGDPEDRAASQRAATPRARLSTSTSLGKYQTQTSSQPLDYLCLAATSKSLGRDGQQLAEYFATVISGDSDYLLRVAPQSIKARDRDELNAPIRYSFVNGTPANYSHYFQINSLDATIKQVAPIERTQVTEFSLFIKAQEQSYNKLFSVAKLTIDVLPTDKSPPVLVPNSYSGFVSENSPIGTRVLARPVGDGPLLDRHNSSGSYLRIAVVDADKAPSQQAEHRAAAVPSHADQPAAGGDAQKAAGKQARYEFETTSDAFKVDRDGFMYVNRFPLDRDLPGLAVHMLQVTARQVGLVSSKSVSSPISLNITLGDLNDNPPQLVNASLGPILMAANSRGGAQQLVRLEALDRDSADNSQMHFSIQHVSNHGSARFRIDEETGRVEALGKFQAGEQFSLTVQVADDLGRSSQGIVDVLVVPGANTGGPQFLTDAGHHEHSGRSRLAADQSELASLSSQVPLARAAYYSAEVSEGVAPNSPILQVRAVDPENDPISYSIIDGNINNDFSINSKTGALVVANKLDREEISAYKLIVQARDSGGLATSRPVHVLVTDLNDQNPVFGQDQYVFAVEEGVPAEAHGEGHLLGRVTAHDSDEGENGRVTYSLVLLDSDLANSAAAPYAPRQLQTPSTLGGATPEDQQQHSKLFSINSTTGDIRLMKPLDYEQAKSHALLVVAHDNGENPRSSSAVVLVRVLDRQDETPYFERFHLEARLDENQPNQRIGLVQARDPDSVAEVTYVILAGDLSLFQVDPYTGLVSTTGVGLDYEQTHFHSLLIGTNESLARADLADATQRLSDAIVAKQMGALTANPLDRSPVVRVDVLVNDLNDNAPQFEAGDLLMPVRVQDSVALGSLLPAQVRARDLDGSSPNNQIRYELVTHASLAPSSASPSEAQQVTSERCAQLFLVDPSGGQVSVRADLKRDSQSECQLVIRARDLPHEPQQWLSSQISLTVYIDHLIEISASSQVGFADSSYTVELAENSPANTLVRLLTIINKPKVAFPMSCEILTGNELSRFYVAENEQRDCELRTRDSFLDYEQRQRFTLTVKLNTVGGGGGGGGGSGGARSTLAQVHVKILDRNDNKPTFAGQPARYNHLTQNKYLAAIAYDSPSETQVIQLRASDLDSSQANGLISYELLNEQDLEGRFKVDPVDGILRTSRPIEDIPATRLPIRLRVLARDNPERAADSLEAVAEVVVNLISDHHRIGLVLKDTPAARVLDNKEDLLGIIQERTGLISGLERVESLKIQRNSSLVEADISGSDVWFYLIEPGSLKIVPSDDPRLKASLFEPRAQSSLADMVSQSLGSARARVRLPYSLINAMNANAQLGSSTLLFGAIRADSSERLASVLILVSLFIAIISAIVVIYQCGTVAGFSESANSQQQAAHMHPSPLHQHFAKDKFLFSPPPPPASQYQFAGSSLGADLVQTPFGSLSRAQSCQHPDKYAVPRSSFGPAPVLVNAGATLFPMLNNNNNNTGGPVGEQQQLPVGSNKDSTNQLKAKEYETQMLKMSVLFDDSQSFDGQNQVS